MRGLISAILHVRAGTFALSPEPPLAELWSLDRANSASPHCFMRSTVVPRTHALTVSALSGETTDNRCAHCSKAASRHDEKKSPAFGGAVSGGNGEVAVGDAKKNTDMIRRTVTNVT